MAIVLPVLALADEGQDAVRVGRVSRRTLDKIDFGIGHFSYNGTVYPIGNVPNGIPVLDGAGKVPLAALPAFASSPVVSVAGRAGVVTLTTSDVVEASNLYFSNARVITAQLTGFTAGAGTVSATDSVLSALQKHDAKIATNTSGITANGTAIAAETSRATGAEGTLTTNVASNTTNIATNTSNITTLTSGKVDKTTTVNGHALSANVSVTQSDVGLSAVTNDAQTKSSVMPNTAPTSGQIPIGTGTAYVPKTIVGDVTFDANGNAVSALMFNVLRSPFSAVADNGVTDNRNPIKSALDASVAAAGRPVYVPAGVYGIGNASPFNLGLYPGVTLQGDGPYSTIFKRINNAAGMFVTSTSTRVAGIVVRDIGFDFNKAVVGGNFAGITIGPNVSQTTWINCRFYNLPNSGITLKASNGNKFINCTFESPGDASGLAVQVAGGSSGNTFEGCEFRFAYGGIVHSDTEPARDNTIVNCRFFGGCWWTLPIYSGTANYTSTSLTDSGASLNIYGTRRSELTTLPGQVIRAMTPKATGGASTSYVDKFGLTDTSGSANFSSGGSNVQVGDFVVAGTACGIVVSVPSSTALRVRDWWSTTDRYRVAAPAANTSYTVYKTWFGHEGGVSPGTSSSTTLNVNQWTDFQGNVSTPPNGTPYEVGYMPNYQGIIAGANSYHWKIEGCTFEQSNSDALALNGGTGHIALGNHFLDNHDTAITDEADGCLIEGNKITHTGSQGIAVLGKNNIISHNEVRATGWLTGSWYTVDIHLSNQSGAWSPTGNTVIGNRCMGDSLPPANHGILLDGVTAPGTVTSNYVANNYVDGHALGEIDFVGTTLVTGNQIRDNIGAVANTPNSSTGLTLGVLTGNTLSRAANDTPAVTHQFLSAFNGSTGAFTQSQPAFSDISGTLAIGQAPTGTTSSTLATGNKGVTTLSLATSGVLYSSPVTFSNDGSGNWTGTLSLATQTANTILAGPTSGGAATPTVRAMVTADLPASATTQGNTFNGTSQLVQTDSNGKLPASVPRQGSFADTTSVLANANSTSAQALNTWTPATTAVFNVTNRNFHFHASGRGTLPNSAFTTYTLKLGGVTIGTWSPGTQTVSSSQAQWIIDGSFTTFATGASGSIVCHGALAQKLNAGANTLTMYSDTNGATVTGIDLTGTPQLALFVTFSANAASPNTCTQDQFSGEVTN